MRRRFIPSFRFSRMIFLPPALSFPAEPRFSIHLLQ
jgi:hypothetical protein